MHKFTKMLGASFACMFVLSIMSLANAADTARVSANMGRANRATQTVRMPGIPTSSVNAIGNVTVDKEGESGSAQPQPQPQPEPQPEPEPAGDCPDGGVRNSSYAIENCMKDISSCINNGALAGGLNDLFNEDMRNAIINGMGLCSVQVDKCIVSVRRNCKPVYRSYADVWVDFNSRVIQPEYYNFVLRKTGLTPNQAENTCRLLDKNTYGTSFAAVANDGLTTNEYNKQVGAYNGQMGNVLIKTNPLGETVNDGNPGVDGERGHYARWDATTGTCYIRVAAYNKDTQIKNSWLFGALGNDQLAEVWRPAGETFSCNKDLFGFSLMKDTNTAALVGVGGGTLLGAGIGALAGAGDVAFDCSDKSSRSKLNAQLNVSVNDYGTARDIIKPYINRVEITDDIDEAQCREIVYLYQSYENNSWCDTYYLCNFDWISDYGGGSKEDFIYSICGDNKVSSASACAAAIKNKLNNGKNVDCFTVIDEEPCPGKGDMVRAQLKTVFDKLDVLNSKHSNMAKSVGTGAAIGAGAGGVATAITAFVERNNINCRVGDGLNTVAFGKSHSIDSLKDFYVKWNLRLPDTVVPTSTAVDCGTWKLACAQYTDAEQCKSVALNYKPNPNTVTTLVRSACMMSGGMCIENSAVAKSYGACAE